MKKLHTSEQGVTALVVVLVIAVVALAGFAAYRVKNAGSQTPSPGSSQPASVTAPAKISSKHDLNTASQALQTAPINSDLNPKQLDGSINNLL